MRGLCVIVCGACLFWAVGRAAAAPTAYTLRYRFRAGQVDKYAIRFTMRAMPHGANAQGGVPPNPGSATSVLKVTRVNPDGSAEVTASLEGLQTSAAGATTSPPEVITYTLSPEGRVSNVKTRPGSTVALPGGGLLDPAALTRISAILPRQAVRPGGQWTEMMPSPLRGGKPVRVTGRLLGVRKVAGQTAARLKQFVALPLSLRVGQPGGAGTASVTGSLQITTVTDFGIDAGKPLSGTVDGGGVVNIKQAGAGAKSAPLALDLQVHADLRLAK